jgi:DNA-binding beta-propeller fold protein YncE
MLRRLTGFFLLLSWLAGRPAISAASGTELWHDVFVAVQDAPHVLVLDPDTLEIAATLDVGLVPSSLAVSVPLKLLVVADGVSARINFVDLGNSETGTLPLDFVPQRIVFAPSGTVLAAIDMVAGKLAFIDAAERKVTAQTADLGPIREALFSDDGHTFYVSDRVGLSAITLADRAIAKRPVSPVPFSAFARSPNGREGFGLRRPDGVIDVFDLRHGEPLDHLHDGLLADGIFVTGTGRFLVLLDNSHQQIAIATVDPLRTVATVPGRPGLSWVYSAWFDTVAFVTSTTERELLVYDLDHAQPRGSIALGAVPGSGAVTPDGGKLFLPIADARAILVVDAPTARLVNRVPLPEAPALAVMAGSYGLCH